MGSLDPISAAPKGCPSGLQETPIASLDPMGGALDLSHCVVQTGDGRFTLELIVQGAHCAGCLNKIERGLLALPGVTQVRMNLSTLRLRVSWTGTDISANDIVAALSGLGFGAAPYDVDASQKQSETELGALLCAIAVAGFAAMNVMLLSIAVWSGGSEMQTSTHTLFHWISAAIALPTVMYAGRTFFRSAWSALKSGQTNMDVPISLALILACCLSLYETVMGNPDTYFDAAVMLLFLLLIGRYLDASLRLKTGEAARRLAALQVTSATRILDGGAIETVPAALIAVGDQLLIPAGQRIPVDCRIEKGRSDIDMQIATGETTPQTLGPDAVLYSGTTNLTSPLTVRAIAGSTDSFLAEITAMVELGEQKKSRFVRIADRAARAYVPVVHTIAFLTFAGWLFVGADLRVAALNAIAVLIITCPCALGLAVPAVQIVTTGRLFKQGILIRSGDALERLAKAKSVVFDKTGTLTKGRFYLTNAESISEEHISIAAALAQHSNHPVARTLHNYQSSSVVTDVVETPGSGLSGIMHGRPIRFGSAAHVGTDDMSGRLTHAWLQVGQETPIKFCFEDEVRPDAGAAIERLMEGGFLVEILSGDNRHAVQSLAEKLGIGSWRAGVNPKEKLTHIQALQANGQAPLMVGDGINDAPALAAATVSASLASGSDISRSAADIIMQGNQLSGLPKAIALARKADLRVKENLGLAIVYNCLAIPLAVFGYVNPLIAALAMSGSSLLVTLNALRMSRA